MKAIRRRKLLGLSDENRKFRIRNGIQFGYPKCCIMDFISRSGGWEDAHEDQKAVLDHEGFIPCVVCARKVLDEGETLKGLISNRTCPTPYPDDSGWVRT